MHVSCRSQGLNRLLRRANVVISLHFLENRKLNGKDLLARQAVLLAASCGYSLHLIGLVQLRIDHHYACVLIHCQSTVVVVAYQPLRTLCKVIQQELVSCEHDQRLCHVKIHG